MANLICSPCARASSSRRVCNCISGVALWYGLFDTQEAPSKGVQGGGQLQQLQLLHTGVRPVAAQPQQPQLLQQTAAPTRSGGGAAPAEPGGMFERHAPQCAPAGHAAACTAVPRCRAAEHDGEVRTAVALPAAGAGRGDATWEAGAFLRLGPPRHAAGRGADPAARSPPAGQRAACSAAAPGVEPSFGLPPASGAGTPASGGAPDGSLGSSGQASRSPAPCAGPVLPGTAASGSACSAGHAASVSTAVGSSDSAGDGWEAASSDWGSAAEDGAWVAARPRPLAGGAPARWALAGPCPDPDPESCSSSGAAAVPPVRALVPRGVGWSDSDAGDSDGPEDARLLAKYGIRHDPAPGLDPHRRARERARHEGRQRDGAAAHGIDARAGLRAGASPRNRDAVQIRARQRPREGSGGAVGGGGADWATPSERRCSRCCSPDGTGSACQHGVGGHAKAHRASAGSGRAGNSAHRDMHARRPAALRVRRRARAGAVAGGCSDRAPGRDSSAASSSATLASSPAEPDLHGELVLLRGALGRGAAALTLGGELALPPSKTQGLQVGSDMGTASAAPQAPLLPELSVESRRYLARYGLMPSSVSAASGGEVSEAGAVVALSMSSKMGVGSPEGLEQSG